MPEQEIVWRPSAQMVRDSNLGRFLRAQGLADYQALVARSEQDPAWFWERVIEFLELRFFQPYRQVMDLSDGIAWARWCVGGTTNLALNCLDRHRGTEVHDKPAVVWEGEDGARRDWSYRELDGEVCRMANALRGLGYGRGDAVALYLPMVPEAVAAFLAVAKIGAVVVPLFSGFAAPAIVTRLVDAGVKAVVTADATLRRGKTVAMKATLDAAVAQVPSVRNVIVVRRLGDAVPWQDGRDRWWHEVAAAQPAEAATEPMDSEARVMIVHTSGTSGKPKGTVHSHFGFTAKVLSDMLLIMDLQRADRFMWMSDMGWVVGPLTVLATLAAGATLVLGEGAPDHPGHERLLRLVQDHRVSYLGVAPTTARALMRHGTATIAKLDLSSLRVTTSTGEPWTPDAWRWFFEHVCRRRAPLLNYAGGTEVGGGIICGTVLHPQRPCSFVGPMPGTGARIFDPEGRPVGPGVLGELVMTLPSPGLTRGLWQDSERYLETYWSRYPGVWHHGDWVMRDEDGSWYMLGRSDDTLNVAGKRTGPAEIEGLLMATGALVEAAAIRVPDPVKGTAVVCVCVPMPGVAADDALAERLSRAVVDGLGVPFRPRALVFVSDLPKTRNMKVMRRVVRAVYLGEEPGDLSSLVNPEAVTELQGRAAG